jgi:hypothetical protein
MEYLIGGAFVAQLVSIAILFMYINSYRKMIVECEALSDKIKIAYDDCNVFLDKELTKTTFN